MWEIHFRLARRARHPHSPRPPCRSPRLTTNPLTESQGGNVLGGAAVKLSGQQSDSALISSQRGTGRDHGGFGTLDSLEEDLDALLRVNPTSSSFVAAPDASTAGQDSSAWESSSFVMKLRLSKVVDLKAGETLWVAGNVRGLGGGQAADAGVQMVQFKPGDAHQLIVLIEPPQDVGIPFSQFLNLSSPISSPGPRARLHHSHSLSPSAASSHYPSFGYTFPHSSFFSLLLPPPHPCSPWVEIET
jgi:hypothetical protein